MVHTRVFGQILQYLLQYSCEYRGHVPQYWTRYRGSSRLIAAHHGSSRCRPYLPGDDELAGAAVLYTHAARVLHRDVWLRDARRLRECAARAQPDCVTRAYVEGVLGPRRDADVSRVLAPRARRGHVVVAARLVEARVVVDEVVADGRVVVAAGLPRDGGARRGTPDQTDVGRGRRPVCNQPHSLLHGPRGGQ